MEVLDENYDELRDIIYELQQEKEKVNDLLLNIFPFTIAEDLKAKGGTAPRIYENVTVCFIDVVDFTRRSTLMTPEELINEINDIFTAIDFIAEKNGCEKIKTIGDAYLAASGLPEENLDHARDSINFALDVLAYIKGKNSFSEKKLEVRIGIHTGKVVAGIVGTKKFVYDIFGDTVNIASRMEKNSEGMKINISETTYSFVKDDFDCIQRGELDVKGKGMMKMFFIEPEQELDEIEEIDKAEEIEEL